MCNWFFVLVLLFFHIIHLQQWMSACEHSRESAPLPKRYLNHKGIDRVRVCNHTDQGNAWYLEKKVGRIAMGNSHLQELPSTSRRHTSYTKKGQKKELWLKGIVFWNKKKMLWKGLLWPAAQVCLCSDYQVTAVQILTGSSKNQNN